MFFNILIILYLLIVNEHTCSGRKSRCSAVTYPVTTDWVFESDAPPPANFSQDLTVFDNGTAVLYLLIDDQREDFNVTLLVNPFDKNGSELDTSDFNLRQYYITCKIFKFENLDHVYYPKVITGWYHFVITNENGTRWKFEPKFYETNYPFIDMGVRLENDGEFTPARTETTMEYRVRMLVPLDCIVVRVNIYERQENLDGAIDHIIHGRILDTQSCWIENIGTNPTARCDRNSLIYLDVRGYRADTNDTWIVYMMWKNLTRGGGVYYLDLSNFDTTLCDKKFGSQEVEIWRPINERIYRDLEEKRDIDTPSTSVTKKNVIQPQHWLWITSILVSLILVTMLFYWVMRWNRLKDLLKEDEKSAAIPTGPFKSINDKKSNQILLIYVRGCPSFVKEVEDVKKRLRECCSGYKIRDVYAPSEFTYLGEIGVEKWIDEILKAGSKVIWFDTPQLRSRLNHQDQDHTCNDFRDEAVPCALELARELYQDAHSQYCYHFVVQMEKFRVENDRGNPLQLFTPETRWLLPDYLSDLCKKLNDLIEPSREHQNSRTLGSNVDSSSYNRTAFMI